MVGGSWESKAVCFSLRPGWDGHLGRPREQHSLGQADKGQQGLLKGPQLPYEQAAGFGPAGNSLQQAQLLLATRSNPQAAAPRAKPSTLCSPPWGHLARANLALKAEESCRALTLPKALVELSCFLSPSATAASTEGPGLSADTGRETKALGEVGRLPLLCQHEPAGTQALQKPSAAGRALENSSPRATALARKLFLSLFWCCSRSTSRTLARACSSSPELCPCWCRMASGGGQRERSHQSRTPQSQPWF